MDAIFTTNKIIFDWFSFTVKDADPEDVISALDLDGVQFIYTYGLHGYKTRYMYDGISINFGSARGDVWVEMTGQGCRAFESYSDLDWYTLCYMVATNDKASMTRIDVAYDDFNGLLDLGLIRDDVHVGNWVSKARTIHDFCDYDSHGVTGASIMVGERGSNIICRIYDKAAERKRSDEIEHWVRCELQIRHNHANNFLYYLLSDDCKSIYGVDIDVNNRLDALYFAVLNNFLRFIDVGANNDTNKWRKPLSDHWRKFVESYGGNAISLYSAPGVEYNLLRLRHNVEDQYGGMIYTYLQLVGADVLAEMVAPKKFKLNKKYQYLLDHERERSRKEG